MAIEIVMFPDEIIELNRELASGYHPELAKQLIDGSVSWEERFATIAAYCDVAMDGMYSVETLCEVVEKELLPRLRRRRVNPNATIILNS